MTTAEGTTKPHDAGPVDLTAVEAALRLLSQPGEVREIRILEAVTLNDRWPRTVAGYFDDWHKAAQAVAKIKSATGFYVTLNPVDPTLLARSVNKLKALGKKDAITSDGNILRRTRLLVDADAKRAAGISASDAEHEAAIAKACAVRAALSETGWPEPILADSGNGGHLIYAVDLPADDGGLVERVLHALADRFDDEQVQVDRVVHNAARITKLYGSTAGKGDAEAASIGRPHRMSQIIDAPSELRVVPRDLLEALAAQAPTPATTSSSNGDGPAYGEPFDMVALLGAHGVETMNTKPYRGGQLWELSVCPFNPDHTGGCACVTLEASGRRGFKCHHASCQGKDWHALRELLEPNRNSHSSKSTATAAAVPKNADEQTEDPWPDPLAEEALHGVAGDIVRTIEPHSEADRVALLAQLLTGFGNLIHNGSYFVAESDRHAAKLFVCLVGISSKARKGTSWGRTSWVLQSVDYQWVKERVRSGLSSGEGLIWQVRDPIWRREPIREKKQIIGYQDVEVDPGVSDKRLLILESELGGVLRVLKRESNTLSAIIRDAWDKSDLRTLTKNSPAVATNCHISIIGHITRNELRRHMTETDMASGLANRFLWLCSRRAKCLPEGGVLNAAEFAPLIHRLEGAAQFAQSSREMRRDQEARAIWSAVYPQLSEGQPGLLGAATSRAEAQVMRLAMIYAILDCSPMIRAEHLRAGLAVWQYSEQSARHIFGSALGDPTADELLRLLRGAGAEGLTRTEISEALGRNVASGEIGRALSVLAEGSLARSAKEKPDSKGRPSMRWFAS